VNIAPATKKAPPGPSRAALGFCGRVASNGRARSSLPHDSRPPNGSTGLVIEAFAFRHGLGRVAKLLAGAPDANGDAIIGAATEFDTDILDDQFEIALRGPTTRERTSRPVR